MQIIIDEHSDKSFYVETINVLNQYRRLIRKPQAKLRDYFRIMPRDAVLYAVLLAAYIALMCWLGTSPILMFFTAVLVVGVFFFALMTFHLNRSLKNFMEQCQRNTPSVLTLDDAGAYRTNAEAYAAKLADLDARYGEAIRAAAHHTILFGDRFPFRYLRLGSAEVAEQ